MCFTYSYSCQCDDDMALLMFIALHFGEISHANEARCAISRWCSATSRRFCHSKTYLCARRTRWILQRAKFQNHSIRVDSRIFVHVPRSVQTVGCEVTEDFHVIPSLCYVISVKYNLTLAHYYELSQIIMVALDRSDITCLPFISEFTCLLMGSYM